MASNQFNPSDTPHSYSSMKVNNEGQSESDLDSAAYIKIDDEKLLGLIADRDPGALEALYDRYARGIYSLARHMLQEPGAAEEVTQDTFFNVWRRASSYKPKLGKVSAWLFSIGHHRIIDELRRRRRHERTTYVPDIESVYEIEDESADPSEYAGRQLRGRQVRNALGTLRPDLRAVVVLAYYGGLSHSEIARKLNQPLGTVKTRMRLALETLRENIGPQARRWLDGG